MSGEQKHGLAVDLRDWFERNCDAVPRYIERYFKGFGGRHFETFLGMGQADRFGPTDFLAVQALEVTVPSGSALRILKDDGEKFTAGLRDLPRCEIWQAERKVFEPEGAAVKLFRLLDDLPGVGTTKATKLMAAKRPHLIPVQDAFIDEELVEPGGKFWLPMYDQLADASLRDFIGKMTSGAPVGVSLLRRIDVSIWMHVKERKKAERASKKVRVRGSD